MVVKAYTHDCEIRLLKRAAEIENHIKNHPNHLCPEAEQHAKDIRSIIQSYEENSDGG